jgi:hypothetical protein
MELVEKIRQAEAQKIIEQVEAEHDNTSRLMKITDIIRD